jgi:hypothetical protein
VHLRPLQVAPSTAGRALIGYDDLPGPRKVAASAPQLDGIDLERWHELLGIWRAIGIHDRVTLLNFARELARGGESARTIGLGEALAEVDRVIAANHHRPPRAAPAAPAKGAG